MQLSGQMKEKFDIHRRKLRALISPRYQPWEIEARAYINAYIQVKMGMNFHQNLEEFFIAGVRWGRENPTPKGGRE